MSNPLYTIGHSTRTAGEFLELLREFEIVQLVDIRQYPGSRRYPQFGRDALSDYLTRVGIAYHWLQALGGRRRSRAESPNVGLRNPAFRSYADYMLTPEFRAGIDELLALFQQRRTTVMCAEAVYWRCHRRLVSDYLVVHGTQVQHILGHGQLRPHLLTPGATARDGQLIYLPAQEKATDDDSADLLPFMKE